MDWIVQPLSRLDRLHTDGVPRSLEHPVKVSSALTTASKTSSQSAAMDSDSQRTPLSSMNSRDVPSLRPGTSVSQDSNGQIVVRNGLYQCPFYFLGCQHSYNDFQVWYNHATSHFHGKRVPSTAQCPFCRSPPWSGSWVARMEHVADHQRAEERLHANCLPDYDLFYHLHQIGVVNVMDYQELVRYRYVDVTQHGYVEMNNPRRDMQRGMPGPTVWKRA